MRASSLRCLPMLIAAGALPLAAQTTGTLQGRVFDAKGTPVAGAKVSLQGSTIQGGRTTTTDNDGAFRFGLLPPGPCVVTVIREGMNTTKSQVQVGLDKTATVEIKMAAIAQAVVEIVDTLAAVDVKATTTGANFTTDTFEKLPISRDFANIALLAPGITQDSLPGGQQGLRVYGASGVENNYVVDGINTTNVEFGSQGKKIPVEFIQEFQVKTGGYEAEYGKATGGVINVITKSGGNEFAGDAFVYLETPRFQAANKHLGEVIPGGKPVQTQYWKLDVGFDMGGPLIKDKLWFFVAYDNTGFNRQDRIVTGATAGSIASQHKTTDLFAGKVTWKINESQNLIASFIGDPSEAKGEVDDPSHPAIGSQSTWDGVQKVGGTDLSLRYEISGQSWFGQFQASRHREVNDVLPGSGGANLIQQIDQTAGNSASGGFGRFDHKSFTRDNFAGSFSRFFDLLGQHEAKFGFDLQTDKADLSRGYTGGQLVTKEAGGVYQHAYWTTPDATLVPFNVPSIIFTSSPKHESQAFFLQDKWTINTHWNVNLGVRTDRTDIKDQFGKSQIKFSGEYAPRLGVVWDWKGSGQDKVFLTMGRFFEQVPMDLVIRSFSIERNPAILNFDPVSTTPDSLAGTSTIAGTSAEPVDSDLKAQYMDQFILGAETTVANRYVFGAKYIRSYFGRVIEDALDSSSGNFFIMNPGFSTTGKQYPRAVRDFKGVELSAQRKFVDHFSWQASYLWSKLDGNYEGGFSGIGYTDGSGQLDPNISGAFDEPPFMVNNFGPLSTDRRHQFKANGYYEWDFGLGLGASFVYSSGAPVTRLGEASQVDPYYTGRYELFLQPRGTEGRTPSIYRLDINVGYSLALRGTHRVRFMADITNVFDSQTATVLDQRYNFSGSDVGQTNPHFKQGMAFQPPRTIRLGVRYTW